MIRHALHSTPNLMRQLKGPMKCQYQFLLWGYPTWSHGQLNNDAHVQNIILKIKIYK